MAKKQKRQVSAASKGSAPAKGPSYVPPSSIRRIATTTEFKPDYSRVIQDLKRIGILAGSFFGILIVLSFFLR